MSMIRRARSSAAVAEGEDVNERGQDDYTAMHAAAENGHLEVLRFLVENGAELSPRMTTGQTPLELARKHPEVVAYLRSLGAVE
ncbi:hypothetical protein AYO47_04485 [Planctomyces sp. SCGC AG-212-M04]|nr:hypothetical protein AYO47_04485 [Planctomyces sp. SCGC AG-212-M04]